MNKLIAPLTALLVLQACGGERDQTRAPGSPTSPQSEIPPPPPPPVETAPAPPPPPPAETPPPPPKAPLGQMERAAISSLVAAFNAHDAHKIASLYAPEARIGGAGPAGWVEETGLGALEIAHSNLFAAFPDMKWGSPRAFVSKDVVIQEWVLTGTHQGTFGSVQPTQKQVGVNGASVYFFDDNGKIKRDNTYYDISTITTQLGVRKGKARAIPAMPEGEPVFVNATGESSDDQWLPAARAFFESYHNRNEKAYLGALAKDVSVSPYSQAADRTGTAAAREDFRAITRAFPDLEVTSRNMWGFGDTVVAEVMFSGTLKGAYLGVNATNKPATLHELDILHFDRDGKITSIESYASGMELSAAPATLTLPAGSKHTKGADTQKPEYDMSPRPNLYPGSSPGPNPNPGSIPGTIPGPQPTGTGPQRRP